jgi:hypothetical protein
VALLSFGSSLIVGEAYFSCISKPPKAVLDERNLNYRFDPELGWIPPENSDTTFTCTTGLVIHTRHNRWGLRDVEHGEKTRPRLAVLGDSFVWGYDVEAEERFTDKLQAALPAWEVVNMGVSGYGTDQEYLLLRRLYERVEPDLVVLVFCGNDHDDNSSNARYGGYYKPYFVESPAGLTLAGTPVPRSVNYRYATLPGLSQKSSLLRAILTLWQRRSAPAVVTNPDPTVAILRELLGFLRSHRASLFLVSTREDATLAEFARRERLPFLELPGYPTTPSGHWTPEAHTAIASVLTEKVKELSPPADGSGASPDK